MTKYIICYTENYINTYSIKNKHFFVYEDATVVKIDHSTLLREFNIYGSCSAFYENDNFT